MKVWKKCGHPKTPQNMTKGGSCRECYNAKARTPEGQAAGRERGARYRRTPKGKAAQIRYRQTPKGQATHDRHHSKESLWRHAARPAISENKAHDLVASRVVVLSDIQIPFEDPVACELALRFTEWFKPDAIILNGDVVDQYETSDFDRDPRNAGAFTQEQVRSWNLMDRLAFVPQRVWLAGNHEDRFRRQLWRIMLNSKSPTLPILKAYSEAMDVDPYDPVESFIHVFQIRQHGFEFYPYGAFFYLANRNLIVTHGFLSSMHSGYSAKRTVDRLGSSCIVGHTHRLGTFFVTNTKGVFAGWENGCLCRLDPEYVQFPNWQQGFSVVLVTGQHFHVIQCPITRKDQVYTLRYGEHEWSLTEGEFAPLSAERIIPA